MLMVTSQFLFTILLFQNSSKHTEEVESLKREIQRQDDIINEQAGLIHVRLFIVIFIIIIYLFNHDPVLYPFWSNLQFNNDRFKISISITCILASLHISNFVKLLWCDEDVFLFSNFAPQRPQVPSHSRAFSRRHPISSSQERANFTQCEWCECSENHFENWNELWIIISDLPPCNDPIVSIKHLYDVCLKNISLEKNYFCRLLYSMPNCIPCPIVHVRDVRRNWSSCVSVIIVQNSLCLHLFNVFSFQKHRTTAVRIGES